MAERLASDGNFLQYKDGKEVVGIHYDAKQLKKLTIYDYTKELLDKNDKICVRLNQAEVNWRFEGNVMTVLAESHPRRTYLLRQTRCAIIMDFWAKRQNKPRYISDDRSMFQVQERDAATADGLWTAMVHRNDRVMIIYAAVHILDWITYKAMAKHIHRVSGQKHIHKGMMDRVWLGIVYNLFWFECPCLKQKKALEMNQEPARKYWERLTRTTHHPPATHSPISRGLQPGPLPLSTDERQSTTNGGSVIPSYGRQPLPYRPTAHQSPQHGRNCSQAPSTPPTRADQLMYVPTPHALAPPNDDDPGYSRLLQNLRLPPVQRALQYPQPAGFGSPSIMPGRDRPVYFPIPYTPANPPPSVENHRLPPLQPVLQHPRPPQLGSPFTPACRANQSVHFSTPYTLANPPPNDDDACYSWFLQNLSLPPVQPSLQHARSPGFGSPRSASSTPSRPTHPADTNEDKGINSFKDGSPEKRFLEHF